MRILITTQPGYGHLHPLLPLVRAATASGQDVLVVTSASMCPVVERAGLRCAAAGMDWLLAREREAFPEMASLPFGAEHFRIQLTRVFRDVTARRMIPELLDICRGWRPDVIVRDDQEHGGLVVAEVLGIPHAVAGVLWLYPPDLQHLAVDALATLLADHGITEAATDVAYRFLTLASMPPEWHAPGEYLPATTHLLKPEAFANEGGSERIEWLEDMPRQPLVHASLGTIVGKQTGLDRTLLEAFADLPVNLVLSAGPDETPASFGPQPTNIRVIDHIPPGILRRCDAAIVHAGYGSTMAAIVTGTPMVMLPVAADQPRNARRCEDLGLGVALYEGQRAPEQVRDAVLTVLNEERYRERTAALAASIDALPGAEHGVALLERLAMTREPIPGEWPAGGRLE